MNDKPKPKKETSGKKTKAKMLAAHVTHLEMTAPLLRSLPVPTRPTIALMRAKNIPSEFYRFLYEMVGKPYHWYDRRILDDDELYNVINNQTNEINVLYADGCPAGFFELSTKPLPEKVEILHFGLGEEYQGMGLGKWFLSTAIQTAWAHKPEKLTIETNTLDHPAALQLYQRLGFSPVAVSDTEIEPWD